MDIIVISPIKHRTFGWMFQTELNNNLLPEKRSWYLEALKDALKEVSPTAVYTATGGKNIIPSSECYKKAFTKEGIQFIEQYNYKSGVYVYVLNRHCNLHIKLSGLYDIVKHIVYNSIHNGGARFDTTYIALGVNGLYYEYDNPNLILNPNDKVLAAVQAINIAELVGMDEPNENTYDNEDKFLLDLRNYHEVYSLIKTAKLKELTEKTLKDIINSAENLDIQIIP